MDFLSKLNNHIINTFDQGILGLSFLEVIAIFAFLILAFIIRGFFAKIIILKIKKIVTKTGNKVDDQIFDALSSPLKTLPLIIVFVSISLFIEIESQLSITLEKINQTLVTFFIFWLLHQSLAPLSEAFNKLEEVLSKAFVLWLVKSLKYLILFLGSVAILDTWGIKIGPVIAGLGLFGVAVALGAQDLFKNLISGIMIILEKRFELYDIIEVPGHATGTVEQIGFRSTLIRKFDSTPVSVPNYVFSDTSIINFSNRKFRRINWVIGLTYETSIDQLKNICEEIMKYIKNNNNYIVNDAYQLFVRVEKFNDSSLDILIQAFTNTNDWNKFLKIKEELIYRIKEIVEKNRSSFAFPSKSIYIEKMDSSKN